MISLKNIDINNLTPMMKQYAKIKKECMDTILFYRLGDFYEMFFDDAIIASKILGLALTGRECGLEERAPMCGVPYHSATQYIKNLISEGYKVAICEQLEDPANSKGLVERGIVKVFTPGTILDDGYLNNSENNFIASVYIEDKIAASFCDISTGELMLENFEIDDFKNLYSEINKFDPKEIIVNDQNLYDKLIKEKLNAIIINSYTKKTLNDLKFLVKDIVGLNNFENFNTLEINSMYMLFQYLIDNKNTKLGHINSASKVLMTSYMGLDDIAIKNLEISKTIFDNSKKGSLLNVLDKTVTSKGSRMLKSMVERPLLNIDQINNRLDIVECFYSDPITSDNIKDLLDYISDIERIVSKIVAKIAGPRDLINLKTSLGVVPKIKDIILSFKSEAFDTIKIDPNDSIYNLINESIVDEPPNFINDGDFIRDGYNKDLDEIKGRSRHSEKLLLDYENKLKEESGIKNLRVKYNKVTGYFIEVSKGQIENVPNYFRRIQTLKNVERYMTSDLSEIEYKILNSSKEALELEKELYDEILNAIIPSIASLKVLAESLAILDALLALADTARLNGYVRPSFNSTGITELKACRHPVVELNTSLEDFIPNDAYFDMVNRYAIITGPNMSGKSTFMRTIALNQILAQIGSFIPADSANLCIIDNIFTRIGASDALNLGKSTFMVEMTEVSNILNNASKDSLILLDEVGRGTSTYDGMSIAFALMEYITKEIGAKTMFSTHYQELSELEKKLPHVFNLTLDIKENNNEILFLRKVKPGVTNKSYGIHVAKLAGLPTELTDIAEEYQEFFAKNDKVSEHSYSQITFLANDQKPASKVKNNNKIEEKVINKIKDLVPDKMSPIDALKFLYEIKEDIYE
ncbi:DNA mismatch repair protein MutS [uncultured Ezakiella sp.]|uniref:DNA mismatch repair protein MutS n=1 Tax=uncultured Ezakiella sp. TaxID=1637529 RepID=UPI0025FB69EE|nr:DNA mismatch repair protein MutS [uncultured Ezakiella sp.]